MPSKSTAQTELQHPTALVSPKARLGNNVKIGPYTIIQDNSNSR